MTQPANELAWMRLTARDGAKKTYYVASTAAQETGSFPVQMRPRCRHGALTIIESRSAEQASANIVHHEKCW